MNSDERAEALSLAGDLLADIELDRTTVDRQVLKASRLARLLEDGQATAWLAKERASYNVGDEDTAQFKAMGRWRKNGDHVYSGAVSIMALVPTLESQLQAIRVPDVAGDWARATTEMAITNIHAVGRLLQEQRMILSRVSAAIHSFASTAHHSLHFATNQQSILEQAKAQIDSLLLPLGEEAVRKIDFAYSNLHAGDADSIAAAMNSVRRLIDGFADHVFPATTEKRITGQGQAIDLSEQRKLNRIKAFIDDNSEAPGHASRLKRAITDIYERVSRGVHNDVSASEAKYLFLSTYVLLGEVLALPGQTKEATASVQLV